MTTNRFLYPLFIGISDGLVLPLAAACGLATAQFPPGTILVTGSIIGIAGALAMGFSTWHTLREEMSHGSGHHHDLLGRIGISASVEREVSAQLHEEHAKWNEAIGVTGHHAEYHAPAAQAIITGLGYLTGALISMAPFAVAKTTSTALLVALPVVLLLLFTSTWLKSRMAGIPAVSQALRSTLYGAFAFVAAYLVARLIS
ncbi:MAG TPA: VIT1/CCC1 transporter family protein [Flavisolibacter sp.]